MIILTSNGLSSPELLQETRNYIASGGKAAIVTTASVGYKEKDWNIPRLTEELEQLGLQVAYVDIETQDPGLLLSYDLVELLGGNPFYLLKQMKTRSSEAVFQAVAAGKILVGISTGSMFCRKVFN